MSVTTVVHKSVCCSSVTGDRACLLDFRFWIYGFGLWLYSARALVQYIVLYSTYCTNFVVCGFGTWLRFGHDLDTIWYTVFELGGAGTVRWYFVQYLYFVQYSDSVCSRISVLDFVFSVCGCTTVPQGAHYTLCRSGTVCVCTSVLQGAHTTPCTVPVVKSGAVRLLFVFRLLTWLSSWILIADCVDLLLIIR